MTAFCQYTALNNFDFFLYYIIKRPVFEGLPHSFIHSVSFKSQSSTVRKTTVSTFSIVNSPLRIWNSLRTPSSSVWKLLSLRPRDSNSRRYAVSSPSSRRSGGADGAASCPVSALPQPPLRRTARRLAPFATFRRDGKSGTAGYGKSVTPRRLRIPSSHSQTLTNSASRWRSRSMTVVSSGEITNGPPHWAPSCKLRVFVLLLFFRRRFSGRSDRLRGGWFLI